jgi:hypothetical protein
MDKQKDENKKRKIDSKRTKKREMKRRKDK